MTRIIVGAISIFLWLSCLGQSRLPPCPKDPSALWTSCYGAISYASGERYVGEWKDDSYSGKGTYTYLDGAKFIGEFKDNKRNGNGVLTLASGSRYVGQFKNDKYNGNGTFTYATGERYVGEFRDDERNGHGTFTYASGERYVGEFQDGKFNGYGTFTYASGERYVGEWRSDERSGRGILYGANGQMVESGYFKNSQLVRSAYVDPERVQNTPSLSTPGISSATSFAPEASTLPNPEAGKGRGANNECKTVGTCVEQTLAAAQDADIDLVRKIATTLDSMPKPNLGNRPIARQLNQMGIEALKRDDLPVALAKLRQALAENPRDVEVAGNLGYAMVKSGKAAEAVEVLQAAVLIDPRRTSTWIPLAEAYALAGRREDARAALWVSFQWSANREKSLAFYQDRMVREARSPLQALYAHMVGVAQEQMSSGR